MTNVYAAFKKLKIFYCHEMDCMKTIIQIPRNRAGVYLLKEKGIVVYVGRSKDVLTRLGAHAFKVYDEVEILWQEDERLDLLERKMIQQFKPKYNRGFPLETSRQKYTDVSLLSTGKFYLCLCAKRAASSNEITGRWLNTKPLRFFSAKSVFKV